MKTTSKWHFPRKTLAESYLDQLDAGLNSVAIFAERRKGKTEFLLDDLEPAAKERGILTVYVNFWEKKSDPAYCINQGVRRSLERDSPRIFKKWKKEFGVNFGLVQARISNAVLSSPEIANESLEMLLGNKSRVLIMFDEIQHLATNPNFEELIATLRTYLDSNKKNVRAIFTGSSQDRLNRIFRNQKAAFYRSASLVAFPDMGENFTDYLAKQFYALTKRKIPKNEIYKIFVEYHCSPFTIVDLLQTMMREGIYDVKDGLKYYLAQNNPTEEWQELWNGLKPIDQLMLSKIIIPQKPFYHADTYELIGKELGLSKVSRGAIQSSAKRLRELDILNNEGRGQWVFESDEFKDYIVTELM